MNDEDVFPIKNNAACQYKWAWSSVYLNKGTTASCHRCKHHKFDVDTIKNFHNLPGKIEDRTKMLNNIWPGNGCEYCRDIEAAGGMSDRTAFTNRDNTILPFEMVNDPTAVEVTPTILEVYFSNLCNQACIYCRPSFSSVIEHEVNKFGPSKFNEDYGQFYSDDRVNYVKYRDKFFEWMEEHGHKLVMFKMLGGEPFYQEEFEMCLDFFDKHPCPNLTWDIFTNLNHDSARFKQKLSKVEKLIHEKKLKKMIAVCSIDTWGPDVEYIRHGLRVNNAEENMLTLLKTDGVEVSIHATMTALSLPSMHLLAEKWHEWKKIDQYTHFHWNTVMAPPCFEIYHFGDKLLGHLDKFINALTEYTNDLDMYFKNNPHQRTILGIRQRMEKSSVNSKEVSILYNFLNELDERRKDDWKSKFPEISKLMQDIIETNDV